jgi:hypothetical protein
LGNQTANRESDVSGFDDLGIPVEQPMAQPADTDIPVAEEQQPSDIPE